MDKASENSKVSFPKHREIDATSKIVPRFLKIKRVHIQLAEPNPLDVFQVISEPQEDDLRGKLREVKISLVDALVAKSCLTLLQSHGL